MIWTAAFPPTDVAFSEAPLGLNDAMPAVTERLARPSVARAPNAVPLAVPLGMPRSPLIVTPGPPFGLFQTGMPAHLAAAGAAATPDKPKNAMVPINGNLP